MNVYFDTSAWNHLEDHDKRENLIHLIQQRKQRVVASVISVGEILRIRDDIRRHKICSTMRTLHGDAPLLERPFDLARAAAQGILQGQEDFLLPRARPGDYLLSCMLDATQPPPTDEIWQWLHNMDDKWAEFKGQLNLLSLEPDLEDLPKVLGSAAFLKILCKLPPAEKLGASLSQMRDIYGKSDVWKALGAMLAYMIKPSTTHAPKNKKRKQLPGAPDLWQAPYLGVVEVFVTRDELLLDAISEIADVAPFRHPRCTEGSDSFFDRLLSAGT